jgi:hypothetical protein
MKRKSFMLLTVAAIMSLPLMSQEQEPAKEMKRPMFMPKSLDDDWTKWIVGQWEGSGDSDAGKGKGLIKIEMDLNGQFLIMRGESQIAEVNTEYLKNTMHASDEEIKQFKIVPYKSLQIYSLDPKTGEIIGYLFDSLRCVAIGKGKRQGNKEIIVWQWTAQGQGTSTRTTEKVDNDRIIITEKYSLPNGNIMNDKWEMVRMKKSEK